MILDFNIFNRRIILGYNQERTLRYGIRHEQGFTAYGCWPLLFGVGSAIPQRRPTSIPKIKYADRAHETTIEDDGRIMSFYIRPYDQHPDRFVCETLEVDCLVSLVDINNKGNIQGIEVILRRRPGQEPLW